MTTREYKLMLTRSQQFAVVLPFIVFTVMPFIFMSVFASEGMKVSPEKELPPFFPYFPGLFFFVGAVFYGWTVGSLPHTISVTYDKRLVFKAFLRTRTVNISELISIEPRTLRIQAGISGYLLTHLNGKILFPGQFTGQYLLLYELKQANPSLELKGC